MSADHPYQSSVADVHSIKQFGKLYIKITVSQIESQFFFQKILEVLSNLNLALH